MVAAVYLAAALLLHFAWLAAVEVFVMLQKIICQQRGGLKNLEESRNFTLVREKSGKLWFACDVLPQLQQSQNKQAEYC